MKNVLVFVIAVVATALVGVGQVSASGNTIFPSKCHLSAGAGEYLIDFGSTTRIFSDRLPNDVTKNVSVPAGSYKVTLESFDGYTYRANTDASRQQKEQYYVQFKNGGSTMATSGVTKDLKDYVQTASWSGVVNNSLVLTKNVTAVTAKHLVPYKTNAPNSLNPVCMLLEPVVNGECNSALDEKYLSQKPSGNLCTRGNASSVSGNGSESHPWKWTCGGSNGGNTDSCWAKRKNVCGDGVKAGNEQCDDGNTTNGDGCSAQCTVETPRIHIDKNDTDNKDDMQSIAQGGTAKFTIVVKNTGSMNLTNVVITDQKAPACGRSAAQTKNLYAGSVFDPGESFSYVCEDKNVNAAYTNSATTNAKTVVGSRSVDDTDTSKVKVSVPQCGNGKVETGEQCDDGNTTNGDGCSTMCKIENPSIKIIKRDAVDKDDTQTHKKGGTAQFEIIVKNNGAVDLKNVKVTDPKEASCNKTVGNLAVGKSTSYTCTSTNVQADFVNVAHAVGTPVNGGSNVTDKDPTTVKIVIPGTPSIKIIKRDAIDKDDSQTVKKGETATFEIIVKNNGAVDLKDVKVTDPKEASCNKTIGNLAVGKSTSYTCTSTNVQEGFTNIAKVVGTSVEEDKKVTDTDPTDVKVVVPGTPSIKVVKRDAIDKDDSQTVKKGETATFEIIVKNNGAVDLKDVKVTDPKEASCNKTIGNLAVGKSTSYTCTSTNVQEGFTNIAKVVGTSVEEDKKVTDTDPTDVKVVVPGTPSIKVVKRDAADKDDSQTHDKGGTAKFEIIVTNDGAVDLKDVKVTDPKEASCNKTVGNLAAGKSVTYTCSTTNVQADFENVAEVVGTSVEDDKKVNDDDPTLVFIKTPQGPICGNGVVEAGEQCDDGNKVNDDACTNQCTVPRIIVDPICGNGIVEAGEQCDDGNRDDDDSCSNQCTIPEEEEEDCDAKIGDTVWEDKNGNGIQDAGEPGIAGVRLKLYDGNDTESDTTDANGYYKFKNICEGKVRVVVKTETLPEGCWQTYDRDGKLDHSYKRKLDDDESYKKADFGYRCPSVRRVSPTTGPGAAAGGAAMLFAGGAAWLNHRRTLNEAKKTLIEFDN